MKNNNTKKRQTKNKDFGKELIYLKITKDFLKSELTIDDYAKQASITYNLQVEKIKNLLLKKSKE